MLVSTYLKNKGLHRKREILEALAGRKAMIINHIPRRGYNPHNYVLGKLFTFPTVSEIENGCGCWTYTDNDDSGLMFENAETLFPYEGDSDDRPGILLSRNIALISYHSHKELNDLIVTEKAKLDFIKAETKKSIDKYVEMQNLIKKYDLGILEEGFLDTLKELEKTKDSFKNEKEFIRLVKIFNDKTINELYTTPEEKKIVDGDKKHTEMPEKADCYDKVCCESEG